MLASFSKQPRTIYKIIATTFDGKVGAYTLTVKAATEAYAKLGQIKSEFQTGMMAAQKAGFDGKNFDMEKYTEAVGDLQLKFLDTYSKFAKDNAEDSTSAGEAKTLARQMVTGLGNSGAPAITEKLRSLVSKSEDKDLLGAASLSLGNHLAKRYESAYMKKDKAAAKFAEEAEVVLEKTGKDFASLNVEVKEAMFYLTNLAIGRKAMEIAGEDIDGKKFKLSDYRGKVVVIDFWGHW